MLINKAPVKQSESGRLFLNSQYMTEDDHGSFLVILHKGSINRSSLLLHGVLLSIF